MATIHGLSKTRIHSIWRKMRDRCNNPNASNYSNYGGRGIIVSNSWNNNFMSFYEWAMSNGYDDHLSIERVDVNGNYEPTNCKWITMSEQSRNRRSTKYVVINETEKPLTEWAELYDLSYKTITTRWYRGIRGPELIAPLKKVMKR
jgi:hypothetical protein